MLSYRKSQQVLLAEKLKKKNVIHVLGVFGSGTTMARLCHSAFARVATMRRARTIPLSAFATAHSRGLRLARSTCAVKRVSFASAHSRGLRLARLIFIICACPLPQRIRAGCDQCANNLRQPDGALPQRIRAGCDDQPHDSHVTSNPLPQRIRAGCDCGKAMQRTANLLREGR